MQTGSNFTYVRGNSTGDCRSGQIRKFNEREIKAVIGASYGDEGKGLMTAHFCKTAQNSGKSCLTVLHNGGAQRGHTVVSENGFRHVFHHLSSGTFSSSDTYFAETFILNPMIFAAEHSELYPDTKIYYSSECKWSTPFDMIINQIAEDSRGDKRHGSCGFGIWETIVRYESENSLCFSDFTALSIEEKKSYLKNIRDNYMHRRLNSLGINKLSDKWQETIYSEGLIDNFISDCDYFAGNTVISSDIILESYPFIVFEGAQGLLLSQDFGENEKHTTPSFTGAENPVRMIKELDGKSDVEVCYVTRTYLTRHGAGPFKEECPKNEINPDMTDMTNVPNGYQGTLRYGKLDVQSLRERIFSDFAKFENISNSYMSLTVTHLNETGGKIIAVNGAFLPEAIGIPRMYFSYDELELTPCVLHDGFGCT